MNNANLKKYAWLAIYCIPFAFLSMYFEAMESMSAFHLITLFAFSYLFAYALKQKQAYLAFIGQGISFLASSVLHQLTGFPPMAHYFKLVTSYGFIVAVTNFALIVQSIVVVLYYLIPKRSKD